MDKLDEMLPYIEQGRFALFIGAGLSKIAGCYDWNSIVREMLDHPAIKEQGINKDDLIGKLSNEELLDYCHKLFKKNNIENEFWGISRRAIMFKPDFFQKDYLPIIRNLQTIKPMPTLILTTNIDDCLEYTNEYDLNRIFYKLEELTLPNMNGSGVFHIHGYKEEFKDSVLTTTQYIKRYQNVDFRDFMKNYFRKYSVLFIGYSMRDREIQKIIFETKDENKKHYLLIPEEDNLSTSEISVYYDLYGISTIVYGKMGSFSDFVDNWIKKNFALTSLTTEAGDSNV